MQVSFSTDSDGFLTQECPSCEGHFKVIFGAGSSEPMSHCPYCGYEGHNCWLTKDQANYAKAIATKVALEPELKKLERSLKGLGGLIKVNLKSQLPAIPARPVDVDGDFNVYHFPCCDEHIKAKRHERLHCVICGKEADLNMSDLKKVFLSHKGIDKQLVKDFHHTLRDLGYSPWLDEDAMPAGTSLERGLLKGMQESCGVVFFITPSFRDENFLATEVDYAIQQKRDKGDKFAIIALQFIGENGEVGTIPELLKGYVWKKPHSHLDALREILRALPVATGIVDWREGIEGVVRMPTLKTKSSELSDEARTILLEATQGDGHVMYSHTSSGEHVYANGKNLVPDDHPRTVSLWIGGKEDLIRRGYIKDLGHKGEVFKVTREGYLAADALKPTNG